MHNESYYSTSLITKTFYSSNLGMKLNNVMLYIFKHFINNRLFTKLFYRIKKNCRTVGSPPPSQTIQNITIFNLTKNYMVK